MALQPRYNTHKTASIKVSGFKILLFFCMTTSSSHFVGCDAATGGDEWIPKPSNAGPVAKSGLAEVASGDGKNVYVL